MNYPRPLFPEVGILGLVPDRWQPHWQARHFVLSRLAAYFQVVWINYPHHLRGSFSAWWQHRAQRDDPATPAGLQVYRPEFWLPLAGRPRWLAEFTSRRRLERARQLLRARGCTRLVLYIWRPEFADALDQIETDLSIYHIDDEYSFSPTQTDIPARERRLLQSAGQVFIHSPALLEKKGNINPHTQFVPNGVDYQAYATPVPEPAALLGIPHPRIGYVGFLKQMLDWPLLLQLSARHPQWCFVFVGPTRPHPAIRPALEQMARRPNVYFLGGKDSNQLGSYPQHLDVCLMPYQLDAYTHCIYPLKMHEYLASGRPVVSAPIRSVQAFRQVITLATTVEEWSQAIERALAAEENSPPRRMARQAVAREHDWDTLVLRIARTIAERLHIDLGNADSDESLLLSLSAPPSLNPRRLAEPGCIYDRPH
jgi:glycosyltransferase involved in cell wall biosynthesis